MKGVCLFALLGLLSCCARSASTNGIPPISSWPAAHRVPPARGDNAIGTKRESASVGTNTRQEDGLCNSHDWNNYFRNFNGLEKFLLTECARAGDCCVDGCCVNVIQQDFEFDGTIFALQALAQCRGATCFSAVLLAPTVGDRIVMLSSLDFRKVGCGVFRLDTVPKKCDSIDVAGCSPGGGLQIDVDREGRDITEIIESSFQAACAGVTSAPQSTLPPRATEEPSEEPSETPPLQSASSSPEPRTSASPEPRTSASPEPRTTAAPFPTSSQPTIFDCVATLRDYSNSSSLIQHMERSMDTVRRQKVVREGTLLCVVLDEDGRDVCATGNHLFKYGERYVTALELCSEEGWQCHTMTEKYTGLKWNVGMEGYYTLDEDRNLHLTPYSSHTGRWMQRIIEPRSQWLWDLMTI